MGCIIPGPNGRWSQGRGRSLGGRNHGLSGQIAGNGQPEIASMEEGPVKVTRAAGEHYSEVNYGPDKTPSRGHLSS